MLAEERRQTDDNQQYQTQHRTIVQQVRRGDIILNQTTEQFDIVIGPVADDDVYQYSVKGNTLTVSDKYGTETYVIKRLTSKELVIKTEEYENMYLLAYFRRVSK